MAITPTTFADMLVVLRNLLNETTPLFWTDAELTDYLELAFVELSSLFGGAETEGSATLATSTTAYALPTDWSKVEHAVYSGTSLVRVELSNFGRLPPSPVGPPRFFTVFAKKIHVSPAPSATENTTTLSLYGYKTLGASTDFSNVHPAVLHAAILHAAASAKEKDQKFGQSSYYMARYQNMVNAAKFALFTQIPDAAQKFQIPNVSTVVRQ